MAFFLSLNSVLSVLLVYYNVLETSCEGRRRSGVISCVVCLGSISTHFSGLCGIMLYILADVETLVDTHLNKILQIIGLIEWLIKCVEMYRRCRCRGFVCVT